MDKSQRSQTAISSTIPEPKTPFLILYFYAYFAVISALFVIFLMRARLFILVSRVITIFKLQAGFRSARAWGFRAFTSQHWFPHFRTSGAYHEVLSGDDTITGSYNEYEGLEMANYTSAFSTSNEDLQERGNDLIQNHTNDPSASITRQTLSAHIASAFETYPEGISCASLVNTITMNLNDYETTDHPTPSTQSHFEEGPFTRTMNEEGMTSSFENVLAPLVDPLVDWILRATEEEGMD